MLELIDEGLGDSTPLTVFDRWDSISRRESCLADFDAFLSTDQAQRGSSLLMSRIPVQQSPARRWRTETPVELGPLDSETALDLTAAIVGDREMSRAVVGDLAAEQEILFLPGVLSTGAQIYMRNVARGVTPSQNTLVDQILDIGTETISKILEQWGCAALNAGTAGLGPYASIMLLSMLGGGSVPMEALNHSGFPTSPLLRLAELGWVVADEDEIALDGALARLAPRELRTLLRSQSTSDYDLLFEGLTRFVRALASSDYDPQGYEYADTLEAALAWIESEVPEASQIKDLFLAAIASPTVDDRYLPYSKDEVAAFRERLEQQEAPTTDAAVAEVVFLSRLGDDADRFLASFASVVRRMIAEEDISSTHLQALDSAAYHGGRRFRRNRELVESRQLLVTPLRHALMQERSVIWSKWAISWLLNTAVGLAALGSLEAASEIASLVDIRLSQLPPPASHHAKADRLQMRHRLAVLFVNVCETPRERSERLLEVAAIAIEGLRHGPQQPSWLARYLNALTRHASEVRQDAQRTAAATSALGTLAAILGPVASWTIRMRTLTAAFLREIGRTSSDPQIAESWIRRSIQLIEGAKDAAFSPAKRGDTTALLTLAQSFDALARCQRLAGGPDIARRTLRQALSLCETAVKGKPTSFGWDLLLRYFDEIESQEGEAEEGEDDAAPEAATDPVSRALGKRIAECKAWIATQSPGDPAITNLRLWILRREWRAQGDIEQVAAQRLKPLGLKWNEASRAEKVSGLRKVYFERRTLLNCIERDAGSFQELLIVEAALESQFQRLIAIYSARTIDTGPVLDLYEKGLRAWPDDNRLLTAKARYLRYVWRYGEAISLYRRMVGSARSDFHRRLATTALIETLYQAAINHSVITVGDIERSSKALLQEALGLLHQIESFRPAAREHGQLSMRIALEMNQPLPWDEIRIVLQAVLEAVAASDTAGDEYLQVRRLLKSQLRDSRLSAVVETTEMVKLLGWLGSLYIRQATLADAVSHPNRIAAAEAAYTAFDGAARLRKKQGLGEHLVLRHFQARSVLIGANAVDNPNPFDADRCGKPDLLSLAEYYLSLNVGRAVGAYRSVLRSELAEVARISPGSSRDPRFLVF